MKKLILFLTIGICFGCTKPQWNANYNVVCDNCTVTYNHGGIQQVDCGGFDLDFATASGEALYLSAMNNYGSGTVKVTISLNGKVMKTVTNSSIATAKYDVQ